MFKKKPKKEKENDLKIDVVEEELMGAEKTEAEPEKKEEKPVETPKEPEKTAEPEKPKEETASAADIVNDLYTQLEIVGKAIVNIEKQIEALKLNQIWLQQYTTNALKATEIK